MLLLYTSDQQVMTVISKPYYRPPAEMVISEKRAKRNTHRYTKKNEKLELSESQLCRSLTLTQSYIMYIYLLYIALTINLIVYSRFYDVT